MRKVLYTALCSFFFFTCATDIYAELPTKSFVTIINQTRGEECCAPGSLAHLQTQLEAAVRLKLPSTFAVRYDALNDERYIQLLQNYSSNFPRYIQLGLLIEVTPSLAKDADVTYAATRSNWYEAQHAYLIGYEAEERIRLVDVLFQRFQQLFRSYPSVTSAWLIDTPTVNYLQEKYEIQTHQITREQWGVDSYTLSGGPPHYPYPASRNWLFIPDFTQDSPIWIVRQTVTDPTYNYGDMSSGFTSQPNDYMNSGRDFAYFRTLVDTALLGQVSGQPGFANLGLENSMEQKYQDEYLLQLEHISSLVSRSQTVAVFPQNLEKHFTQKLSLYSSAPTQASRAYWITTPEYRARLLVSPGNSRITDLRIYSPTLVDPYSFTVAKQKGYWIAPFLFDASRFYEHTVGDFPPVSNDVVTKHSSILFGSSDLDMSKSIFRDDTLQLPSTVAQSENVIFRADSIVMPSTSVIQYVAHSTAPIHHTSTSAIWKTDDQDFLKLGIRPESEGLVARFKINTALQRTAWERQYPFLYPEQVEREFDPAKSRVYIDNRYALVNSNPVRMVLKSRDAFSYPLTLSDDRIEISAEPNSIIVSKVGVLEDATYQYLDFESTVPGKVRVTMRIDNYKTAEVIHEDMVYFAPNCANRLLYCATHPLDAYYFLRTKLANLQKK